ncbi:hypothetical protein V8G69_00155 [Gaetbulibacter sp. M235]
MKQKYLYIILGIALIITLIGLITGKFFFLFLILPFGFSFFRKNKGDDTN